MGSVLFVILRTNKVIDTPFDWIILCLLVSIDTLTFVNFLRYLQRRRM